MSDTVELQKGNRVRITGEVSCLAVQWWGVVSDIQVNGGVAELEITCDPEGDEDPRISLFYYEGAWRGSGGAPLDVQVVR